ncbi:MAG: hypothetical protein WKG07_10660 [Hymenobacter sp.]
MCSSGPEDEAFRRSPLHQLPNVFFLGTKPPQQLAAYLHYCDVCLNPQTTQRHHHRQLPSQD